MCRHYRVEHDVVVVVHRRVPDEHIPVVFFLAEHCHVGPHVIVDLRLRGKSWMDIAFHFGLRADVFHVEVSRIHGPPYGNAFGHFKRPRAEWAAIRLPDDDVVTLVNAKFLSAHHGVSPDEVIEMRGKEESFVKLQGRMKAAGAKAGPKEASQGPAAKSGGKERAAVESGAPGKDVREAPSGPAGGHKSGKTRGEGRGKGK